MTWTCFQIQSLGERGKAPFSAYKGKKIISMTQDFFYVKEPWWGQGNPRVLGYPREESRSLKSLAPKTLFIAVHGAEPPLFVQDFDSQWWDRKNWQSGFLHRRKNTSRKLRKSNMHTINVPDWQPVLEGLIRTLKFMASIILYRKSTGSESSDIAFFFFLIFMSELGRQCSNVTENWEPFILLGESRRD